MSDIRLAMTVDAGNPIAGDIYIDPATGDIRLTEGLAETVQQDLLICLRMFQGEWFLDPTQGMPYYQNILGQKASQGIVLQIFRSAILSRPGIQSLDKLTLVATGPRSVQLNFSLTLNDGTVLTSASFPPFIVGTGA